MVCVIPVLHGCAWYICCYVRKKTLLQCLAINERRDMGLYAVPLSVFVGICDGGYVRQLPYVWYYEQFSTCSWGMRVQEGLCVLGAWCLVCQDLVICFYFVLMPLGPELW